MDALMIFLGRLWHISKRGLFIAALIASLPLLLPSLSIATFIGITIAFHLACGALVLAFLRRLFWGSSSSSKALKSPLPIEVRAFVRVPPSCSVGFVEGFAVGLSQLEQQQRFLEDDFDQLSQTSFGSPTSWRSFDPSPVELNSEMSNVAAVEERNHESLSSILGVDEEHLVEATTTTTTIQEQRLLDDCCCSAVKPGLGSSVDEDHQGRPSSMSNSETGLGSPVVDEDDQRKPSSMSKLLESLVDEGDQGRPSSMSKLRRGLESLGWVTLLDEVGDQGTRSWTSSWCDNQDRVPPTIGESEAKECMKVVEYCLAQAAGFGLDEDDDDGMDPEHIVEDEDDDFAGEFSFPGRSHLLLEQSEVLEKLAREQHSTSTSKVVEKLLADQRQRRLSNMASEDDDSPPPSSSLTCTQAYTSTSSNSSSLWSSNDKPSRSSSTPTSSASSVNNAEEDKYRTPPPADALGYGRRLFRPAAMSLPAKPTRRRARFLDESSSSCSSSSTSNNDFFCDTDPALSRFAQLLRFWRAKEREMDSISKSRRKDLFGRLNNNQQCPSSPPK